MLGAVSTSSVAFSQESAIELGKKNIALDEPFAITLVIREAQDQHTYSPFPDIAGMQKREVTTVNLKEGSTGKYIISQRITQYYLAAKTGKFTLLPFRMTINGRVLRSPGTTITVEAPGRAAPADTLASRLYNEIMGMEKEVAEKKEDAFLAVSTDRDTVFTGEGFMLTLALYVAENNQVEMRSFGEGAQLLKLLRALKPANCWEQDFNLREFVTSQVTVNRKKYTQYKMYQAAFYPLMPDTVLLPAVSFRLLKVQAAGARGGPAQDTVTFFSQPRVVYVKPLPPHPLRDGIPVGNFRLEEGVSNRRLRTGESFTYQLSVSGEGNLSTVNLAPARTGTAIDFFPPDVKANVNTQYSRPAGRKTFRFTGIPREPGRYPLDSVFRLVYFNPARRQYDTLRPRMSLDVDGPSLRTGRIQAGELEPVYRDIAAESNELSPLQREYPVRHIANALLVLMMLGTMVLMGYKK
ncbi:MAG: BatD family protein [Cytophagales bacterium]|nr:BatD family protein [Cytophagales bacterium]